MKNKLVLLGAAVAASIVLVPSLLLAGGSFYIDDITSFVGIGNTTPASRLDVSGALYSRLVTATSTTINWNAANVQTKTLTANETLAFSSGQAGGRYALILKQDGTGGRTVAWPSSVKWVNGTAPTLTTSANGVDSADFIYDGTNYLGSYYAGYGLSTLGNSLLSYWKFDESSGNASDSKGSNTLTNNNSTAYTTGKINNGANVVAASSNNFSIADASQSGLDLSGDLTFSLWVKMASAPSTDSYYDLTTKWASGDGAYTLSYRDSSGTKKIRLNLYDSGAPGTNVAGDWNVTLSNSTWYNLVVTYNVSSDTAELWVNGSSQGTQTISISSINNSAGAFKVGAGPFGNLDGVADELGVWNRVLTNTEIGQLYNSGSGNQYPF